MIDFRTDTSGFILGFKGRNRPRYCRTNACLATGRGEGRIVTMQGKLHVVSQRTAGWTAVKKFKGILVSPEYVVIDFKGLERLEARYEDGCFILKLISSDVTVNRFRIFLETDPAEAIYGCGEQFSRTDLRGCFFPLWVSGSGVGRGRNYVRVMADLHSVRVGTIAQTYYPQPSFATSLNMHCHAVSSSYSVFDFRQIPQSNILGVGQSQAATINGFTRLLW